MSVRVSPTRPESSRGPTRTFLLLIGRGKSLLVDSERIEAMSFVHVSWERVVTFFEEEFDVGATVRSLRRRGLL